EIKLGLTTLLGEPIEFSSTYPAKSTLIISKFDKLDIKIQNKLKKIKIPKDGYYIGSLAGNIILTAKEDIGILYGVFNFLQRLQTHQSISDLEVLDGPKIDLRILNHWDNLDGTVERGYAGKSLWKWQKLPEYIDQ